MHGPPAISRVVPVPYSLSPSRFRLVAIAGALALMSFIVSAATTQRLRSSITVLRGANESRLALEQLLSVLKDAETGQRGYIIAGDDAYRAPLESASRQLPDLFARIYRMAPESDDPEAERREIAAIQELSDRKLAELRETITVRQRLGASAAVELVLTGEGTSLMEALRTRLGVMIERHQRVLEERRVRMREDLFHGELAVLCTGAVAVGCGFLSFLQFRHSLRRAQEAERLARGKLAAESADREKSAFLATMSHEIRTPMNAILGFGDILRSELSDPRQRGFADSILESGRSLLRLINDILDLSKIESGRLELRIEPVDLRAVAHFVERLFAQTAQESALTWTVEVAEDLPPSVLMDEMRLRQILLNIVGNAFKFTKQGGVSLRITGGRSPSAIRSRVQLVIEVQDSGAGIPADRLGRVFEPFVQAGADPRAEARGTGLGLAIVKRLVQLMNGQIHAESTLGRGSIFRVGFPEVEISARLAQSELVEAAAASVDFNLLAPSRVLIVDDIETNRQLLREILVRTHHTVLESADGREAVSCILRERPDIVLMDVRMPGLNGHEALLEIRGCTGFELLPVIAVTASSLQGEENQLRRDFSGYLRKPFSRAELFAEMSAFLKRRSQAVDPPIDETSEPPLPAVVGGRLRRLLADDFPRVRDGLAAQDVRTFADAISGLAAGGDSASLQRFASDLRAAAENFSVSQLESVLVTFPDLVSRLAPDA